MVLDRKLSRRQLLRAGAASAAAAALLPLGPSGVFAAPGAGPKGRLIPEDKVGTITFTQRDVPGRLAISTGNPVMGFLGGANFPADPTDLGPLVPLPGGWKELFEYFAAVGIAQVEFAGYGQNAANPGGSFANPNNPANWPAYLAFAPTLRGFLDDNGL